MYRNAIPYQSSMPAGEACMSAKLRRRWLLVIQFLVIGYSCLGRSFAYLGVPQAKLFLGGDLPGVLLHDASARGRQRRAPGTRCSRQTQVLRVALTLFILYGMVSILHGFMLRHPTMPMLMNFAFNYYALYMIIGVAAAMGGSEPFMALLVRRLAWIHGIYGIAYIAGLHNLRLEIPGSGGVSIWAQPTASAFAVLGLLAYEPKVTRASRFPILLNLMVDGRGAGAGRVARLHARLHALVGAGKARSSSSWGLRACRSCCWRWDCFSTSGFPGYPVAAGRSPSRASSAHAFSSIAPRPGRRLRRRR